MRSKRFAAACAACGAALLLAACGGGTPMEPDAPGAVPASAWRSAPAFTRFAAGLAADDRATPLGMPPDAVAPTSETDDPLPLT